MRKFFIIVNIIIFLNNSLNSQINEIEIIKTPTPHYLEKTIEEYSKIGDLQVYINKTIYNDLIIDSDIGFRSIFKYDSVYILILKNKKQVLNFNPNSYTKNKQLKKHITSVEVDKNYVYNIVHKNQTDLSRIMNTKWRGFYICSNNKTELDFEIFTQNNKMIGLFKFNYLNRVKGEFLVSAKSFNSIYRTIQFEPYKWIIKPNNYDMVGLKGSFDNNYYYFTGEITYNNCSKFYLKNTLKQDIYKKYYGIIHNKSSNTINVLIEGVDNLNFFSQYTVNPKTLFNDSLPAGSYKISVKDTHGWHSDLLIQLNVNPDKIHDYQNIKCFWSVWYGK